MTFLQFYLPEAATLRERALASDFIDWTGYDGQVYKRICLADIPELREAIEARMGPVEMLGMGYRLNFNGELPNAAIHSDMGWGTHAAVLYLSEGDGGTAFWEHKATGMRHFPPGDVALFEQVKDDWDDASKWTQTDLCRMELGKVVIYRSELFHSRWPFEAFGTSEDTGRLIAVAFFTPGEWP